MTYKPIPVEEAKKIAETFDKDQVIIVGWDLASGSTHITTFGKGPENAKQAATGGRVIRVKLGLNQEVVFEDYVTSHVCDGIAGAPCGVPNSNKPCSVCGAWPQTEAGPTDDEDHF